MPKDHNLIIPSDTSRNQSAQASIGSDMSSGGIASRAQSAGDRNVNAGYSQNNVGYASGGGQSTQGTGQSVTYSSK